MTSTTLLSGIPRSISHELFSTNKRQRRYKQFLTLLRVALPSVFIGFISFLGFPGLCLTLATNLNDAGVFTVLSQDSSQFVQNFLTVSGLLFSILVGQTYYFLYTQTESIYYALFNEVTEAKSLLEQVALVCQGRSMYPKCLESIQRYVRDDLKMIKSDPAVLLSARPVDDPLESIMYMTSVGVPSTIYETVKSLREARAARLGALQRKLPTIHILLLWVLALIEIVSFPLLGAGTQVIGGYSILTVEGTLFGVMTAGIVLTLRVVGELWRPAGGAYNVDAVLAVMVSGLEEELKARMAGASIGSSSKFSPSSASNDTTAVVANNRLMNSGSGSSNNNSTSPTHPASNFNAEFSPTPRVRSVPPSLSTPLSSWKAVTAPSLQQELASSSPTSLSTTSTTSARRQRQSKTTLSAKKTKNVPSRLAIVAMRWWGHWLPNSWMSQREKQHKDLPPQ